MTKIIHTATAPDGTQHTFTSDDVVYTHAVLARRSHDADVSAAYAAPARELDRQAWRHDQHRIDDVDFNAYHARKVGERASEIEARRKAGYYKKWILVSWCPKLEQADANVVGLNAHPNWRDACVVPVTNDHGAGDKDNRIAALEERIRLLREGLQWVADWSKDEEIAAVAEEALKEDAQ